MGYTDTELALIQTRWGLRFPPDLIDLLKQQRRLLADQNDFDWLLTDPKTIEAMLDWPYQGFLFDVENTNTWWPEWGDRPDSAEARAARLRQVFKEQAPKLIPLMGHRYLPEEPHEAGNPIFSVYQTDVICYGADLADWMERDRRGGSPHRPLPAIKEIRFWSESLRKNGAAPWEDKPAMQVAGGRLFAALYPTLDAWAKQNGLALYTGGEACITYALSDEDECFQIQILPPNDGQIAIRFVSVENSGEEDRDHSLMAAEAELRQALDGVLFKIKTWKSSQSEPE
jgi:hypothetical protein